MSRKDSEQLDERQWQQQTLRLCVALIVLLSLFLMVVSADAADPVSDVAGPLEIRLTSRAAVDGVQVRLLDVAELSGGSEVMRKALAELVVADAVEPGHTINVSIDGVMRRVAQAGANMADVLLSGSATCCVRRLATEASATSRPSVVGTPMVRTLKRRLEQYIGERAANLAGKLDIRFDQTSRDALSLTEPEYEFRVRCRNGEALGMVSLEVEVVRDGKPLQRVPVVAYVGAEVEVVVARQPISRGVEIHDRDVVLEPRQFDRVNQIGLTDLSAVVGQQSGRFVSRGEQLSARDIKPVPLVKRGDVVKVNLRHGGFIVEAAGKSLGGGCYGEMVEIRAAGSRETFLAKITGLRTVQVSGS